MKYTNFVLTAIAALLLINALVMTGLMPVKKAHAALPQTSSVSIQGNVLGEHISPPRNVSLVKVDDGYALAVSIVERD